MLHPHTRNIVNSALASTVRRWRGTSGSKKSIQPQHAITLFDREGCSHSRLVREALSELNLDAKIYPCPHKGSRHRQTLIELSGRDEIPYLYDENTGARITGAQGILHYLYSEYLGSKPPAALQETVLNLALSRMATSIRRGAGVNARPSKMVEEPLTLYSFESSPFSRPVRELLCELELPYTLINLSKQQRMDMGPANFRLHLGEYVPIPGSKRECFLKQFGRVQVPFLIDPNTDESLFESSEIIRYLLSQYAVEKDS